MFAQISDLWGSRPRRFDLAVRVRQTQTNGVVNYKVKVQSVKGLGEGCAK
jgi:hypothetical protein